MTKVNQHFPVVAVAIIFAFLFFVRCNNQDVLPEKWQEAWSSPGVNYRPLQIVHGADIRTKPAYFKNTCGLGGVVCNVAFGNNYLKSEDDWKIFTEGVKAMHDNGLRVWIYDEDGYPSLGAGGRILEADPSLEALEMVYDKDSKNQFYVRRCYEYTHACNNYYCARRYPNPLNPKATQKFIELTHEAYLKHLGPELYGGVEAFFTDEPSMMAVNLGQLAESVRKNVRVKDPLDLKNKNLPMISWAEDLPGIYKEKYGEDLMASVSSLFMGDEEKDKVVRQKFWSMLAELDKGNYYDAIRKWSKAVREQNGGKGPVSSGHCLREEYPAIHVPLDGNKLLVGTGFDIPGLDELNSDPSIWSRNAWMAASFPSSSAVLVGQRRVMCEMSDFSQTMSGKGPAPVQEMQAATAWQMAFGVTDFNLYYTISYGDKYSYRKEPEYKEYCDFVGRVNSIVKEADPVRKVLLYYPVYDLQREYIPAAEPMSRKTQSELSQTIESLFKNLGSNLLQAQTPFVLVDYLTLGKAVVTENKTVQIGQHQYTSIVFPKGVVFPSSVSDLIDQAKNKGVTIVFAGDYAETPSPEQLSELTGNENKLAPASTEIAFGKFTREGRTIYMMVNTGKENYHGELELTCGKRYIEMDPQTGSVLASQKISGNKIALDLASYRTKIIAVL